MDIYTQEIPSMLLTVCVVSWLLELSHNYRWVSIVDLIIDTNKNTLCLFKTCACVLNKPKCEKMVGPPLCTLHYESQYFALLYKCGCHT